MTAASDQARLLDALQDGKPHSSHELYTLGIHITLTVDELRRAGHTIRSYREHHRDRFGRGNPITFYILIPPLEAAEAKTDTLPTRGEKPAASRVGTASPASSVGVSGLTANQADTPTLFPIPKAAA